jgi:hypothetical protein
MPTKLGTVFLGMMVGGSTFLITGFAVFLAISQLQYRGLGVVPESYKAPVTDRRIVSQSNIVDGLTHGWP